jgi:hypothetical protein
MVLKYFAFRQEGQELQTLTEHLPATGRMARADLASEFRLDAFTIKLDGIKYATNEAGFFEPPAAAGNDPASPIYVTGRLIGVCAS